MGRWTENLNRTRWDGESRDAHQLSTNVRFQQREVGKSRRVCVDRLFVVMCTIYEGVKQSDHEWGYGCCEKKILGMQLSLSQRGSAKHVLQESTTSPQRPAIQYFHLDLGDREMWQPYFHNEARQKTD